MYPSYMIQREKQKGQGRAPVKGQHIQQKERYHCHERLFAKQSLLGTSSSILITVRRADCEGQLQWDRRTAPPLLLEIIPSDRTLPSAHLMEGQEEQLC